jgi:hypothetical protein
MTRRFIAYFTAALIVLAVSNPSEAQQEKTFKTKYTTIHYNDDKDLSDLLWKLGGARIDFTADREMASNRIDKVIERVETILDMRPKDLNINIYLARGELKYNEVAYYQYKTSALYISVDNVTDGVFAHEITHAIINSYFTMPTPAKIQEILGQYVDKYLWSDY